ncbi:hypothetical protein RHGRI_017409 [Rhododendron griersonianum]|uniref:Methyltransferase n=1 Tax=Rhododendron griersonianum TaxID=479676 RepID=A0AAV6JXP0_9ERIC|nr:hypothetical protein RHGRI_017409 [Rhododendron griersonianum]
MDKSPKTILDPLPEYVRVLVIRNFSGLSWVEANRRQEQPSGLFLQTTQRSHEESRPLRRRYRSLHLLRPRPPLRVLQRRQVVLTLFKTIRVLSKMFYCDSLVISRSSDNNNRLSNQWSLVDDCDESLENTNRFMKQHQDVASAKTNGRVKESLKFEVFSVGSYKLGFHVDQRDDFINKMFVLNADIRWPRLNSEGLVSEAIESFIWADDATQFLDVVRAAQDADVYHDLVKYLLMVRKKTKEPRVDSELIYAYAKIDRLDDIEEFILMPNVANLPNVGDHLYDEGLYEAAEIFFAFIRNWAKLASTLVKLKQFQGAVDAARKACSSKTWKEVCFACVDAEEFGLAQICGLNIIIQELTYSYIQYDEFDNAATTTMNHSPEAWDHMQFKESAVASMITEKRGRFGFWLRPGPLCRAKLVAGKILPSLQKLNYHDFVNKLTNLGPMLVEVAGKGSSSSSSAFDSVSPTPRPDIYTNYRRIKEQAASDYLELRSLSSEATSTREFSFCGKDSENYVPCYNVSGNLLVGLKDGEEFDRHCEVSREQLRCLVRLPKEYKIPLKWPAGKDVVWSGNVKISKDQFLSSGSLTKRLMLLEENQISFHSKDGLIYDGVKDYSHQIAEMIGLGSDTEFYQAGVRTLLDIGCGFGSFGSHLLSLKLMVVWIAAYEVTGSKVQLALERGLPAIIGNFISRQLPYPSLSFSMVHCAQCGIFWEKKEDEHYQASVSVNLKKVIVPDQSLCALLPIKTGDCTS